MAEIIPLPRPSRAPERTAPEPLWREVLGRLLRRRRHARGERLADTAARAGVSPQYLSEVERGLKEPSSEMIAAIAGALGATLLDLTVSAAAELGGATAGRPTSLDLGSAASAPLAPAAPVSGAVVRAA